MAAITPPLRPRQAPRNEERDDSAELDYEEGGSTNVTVLAPSVLVDDLELEKVSDTLPKLPIAPSPLIAQIGR